jgi:hypothetical protein
MKIEPKIVLNFVACQLAWSACVLGGANGRPLAGALVAAAVIGLHLALARRPAPEALLIVAASLIGLVWDSALIAIGLFTYPSGILVPGLAPYWMIALWAVFATSLNLSMGFLKGRLWLAALVGGIGGPVSYLAGGRLGGLEMSDPVLALGAQALGWAVLLPVLTHLAARWDGCSVAPSSAAPQKCEDPTLIPQEVRSHV